jgi:hypothetical protein
MENPNHAREFDNFDDRPPNREHEERVSRRLLLIMLGAGLTVFAMYSFAAVCAALVRSL